MNMKHESRDALYLRRGHALPLVARARVAHDRRRASVQSEKRADIGTRESMGENYRGWLSNTDFRQFCQSTAQKYVNNVAVSMGGSQSTPSVTLHTPDIGRVPRQRLETRTGRRQ